MFLVSIIINIFQHKYAKYALTSLSKCGQSALTPNSDAEVPWLFAVKSIGGFDDVQMYRFFLMSRQCAHGSELIKINV
jgi:hypothetical protein